MNFAEILEKKAKVYPVKPAIIFKGQTITFLQLKETAFRLASSLIKLGTKKGDRVAIYLSNCPEYIYCFLGVFLQRGVCVPLDFMLTEEEVINFINHSESKIIITQEKKGVDLNKVKKSCPSLEKIIIFQENIGLSTGEDFLSLEELLKEEAAFPKIEIEEKDYSSIFYTSGSTGHPKGVLLNYGHLLNPIETVDYFLHPTDQDSFICAGVPFSHVGGLDYMLFMLYFGTTLLLMERFHPLEFLKDIEKYRITIFCIVPSMYVAVLSLKEYDKFDLSSLRYAVVFGAPSSPILLERFHRVCPNAYLLNGWGLTETAAPNGYLATGTNTKEIPHTGKFPPDLQAKLVDNEGSSFEGEAQGELWLKGRAIMVGYYKEPALTNQVLTPDGWFKTGDIARRDSLGRYSIVGRKKEMIKVAGEIVFEPEVEEAIQRHPKVLEAAVIGVPDRLRGEVPKALVVAKPNEKLEAEELRFFLKDHLAHFKIPHYFEFVEVLPKNRTGKIDKEKLRQGNLEGEKVH